MENENCAPEPEELDVVEILERSLREDGESDNEIFTKGSARAARAKKEKTAPQGSVGAFAARATANKGFARRSADSRPKITIVDKTKR